MSYQITHGIVTNRSACSFFIIIIFFDPGTSFPGCETLSKVCGVWNGYNGDSEIVKVLDRQTALKCCVSAGTGMSLLLLLSYRPIHQWIKTKPSMPDWIHYPLTYPDSPCHKQKASPTLHLCTGNMVCQVVLQKHWFGWVRWESKVYFLGNISDENHQN